MIRPIPSNRGRAEGTERFAENCRSRRESLATRGIRMNTLIGLLARVRYSSLFYLVIAALLALGVLSFVGEGFTPTPPPPGRPDGPATVINRNGVWVRDPTARYGYAQAH